jgi:hypothetical protein
MTRKDSEKETDRPHYYSQFWLDVAAGRTVIGAPKVEDEAELADTELEMPEPTPLRKAGRSTASATDGYKPARAQAVVEPALAPEEFAEPEEDEFEQEEEVDDLELPNIGVEDAEEETAIPPEAEETEEQEEEEDLFYDEEEDEEEEDEDSWGARGRKKPKPGRQVKPPKPLKKPKREPRRGF